MDFSWLKQLAKVIVGAIFAKLPTLAIDLHFKFRLGPRDWALKQIQK